MSWIPSGDTIIVERVKVSDSILLPDDINHTDGDIYKVLAVGMGYVTEQGENIPPEVKAGDNAVIKGKVLSINTPSGQVLLARAQDVVLYERGKR